MGTRTKGGPSSTSSSEQAQRDRSTYPRGGLSLRYLLQSGASAGVACTSGTDPGSLGRYDEKEGDKRDKGGAGQSC